jgi:hypothetical protein
VKGDRAGEAGETGSGRSEGTDHASRSERGSLPERGPGPGASALDRGTSLPDKSPPLAIQGGEYHTAMGGGGGGGGGGKAKDHLGLSFDYHKEQEEERKEAMRPLKEGDRRAAEREAEYKRLAAHRAK